MPDISPQIRRLCQVIRVGGGLFVAGVLAIYLYSWLLPSQPFPPLRFHLAGLPTNALASLGVGERLLVALLSVPYLAALVWAFYRMHRMLQGFERGEFFDAATVGHLRAFSGFLLLAKLLALLAMHARVHVVNYLLESSGVRGFINLSLDDLSVLLMCALFFLIARTLEEARRLSEENKGFI